MLEQLILCCLVTFTMTVMLKDMLGPFDIFETLRGALCDYNDANNDPVNFFGKLFNCHWCLATWVSAVVALVTVIIFGMWWPYFFYLWLSAIAVTGVVYEKVM